MMRALPRYLLVLGLCSPVQACALLTKGEPQIPRYFSPHYADAAGQDGTLSPVSTVGPQGTVGPALRLRLGRVSASSNLRERMAYRSSELEIRYYADRRWSDRPGSYLEQALARSLFEQHGLTYVLSGNAPTLSVELTAFEEIKPKPHRVRVEATMVLHHDKVARLHETVRVEEQVADVAEEQEPEAVVQAFSTALQAVVQRVALRSIDTLSAIETAAASSAAASLPPTPQ